MNKNNISKGNKSRKRGLIRRKSRSKRKKERKIKVMEKCSPKSDDEILEYTCYTEEALHKIKKLWNLRHSDSKIESNNTKTIWKELKTKLSSSCNKESCWLKHKCIKDGISKEVISNTFAPSQPDSWKKNPNEWLNSLDIQNVMKQYEKTYKCFEFIGPSPIDFDTPKGYGECVWDELCNFDLIKEIKDGKTKIGIIFNTDPHTKDGAHWIAMFINIKKKQIIYMDSYGDKPPKEVTRLANKIQEQSKKIGKEFEYIKITMRHQYSNSECGMYCLYFIIESLQGKNWTFFNKKKIPDKKMVKLRGIYFNKSN